MNPQLAAMIAQLMPFIQQGGVGQHLTPGMQSAATMGPGAAVTPADAASATVAGVQPGAPPPSSFNPVGGAGNALGSLAGAGILGQHEPLRRPEIAPGFRGPGGPGGPQLGRPIAPAAGSTPSVGSFLTSPAGRQLMAQLRALMSGAPGNA